MSYLDQRPYNGIDGARSDYTTGTVDLYLLGEHALDIHLHSHSSI